MLRIVCFAALLALACACGITTHIEATHRARSFFGTLPGGLPDETVQRYRQYMITHEEYMEAGSPFPDWGYACGPHDVGEDTHWVPFLQAAARYVHRTYPDPSKWDAKATALVSFLMGVASHQVADISWHSLGVDEGFLQAMGAANFHNAFDNAHNFGDKMDDAAVLFELRLTWEKTIGNWKVPLDDLVAIYQEFEPTQNITRGHINNCMRLLFLGRLGEKVAIGATYLTPSSLAFSGVHSPFLVDNFDTYFLGGLTDMALWASLQWHQFIVMLENPNAKCTGPHSTLELRCDGSASPPADRYTHSSANNKFAAPSRKELTERHLRRQRAVERLMPDWREQVDQLLTIVVEEEDGVVTYSAKPKNAKARLLMGLRDTVDQAVHASAHARTPLYPTSPPAHAHAGRAVAVGDFNGDGADDVAVGLPGMASNGLPYHGSVDIFFGTKGSKNYATTPSLSLRGVAPFSSFGSALAFADLNGDGVADLAVGSPMEGMGTLAYTGAVYIFLGGSSPATSPSVTIAGDATTTAHRTLGLTLASGDMDGDGFADLAISSPHASPNGRRQAGSMWLLLSSDFKSKTSSCAATACLIDDVSSAQLHGQADYQWLGHTVSIAPHITPPLLLVSSPYLRRCDTDPCARFKDTDVQGAGQLWAGSLVNGTLAPSFQLVGEREFEGFGSSAAAGAPAPSQAHIAVGSPWVDVKGALAHIPHTWTQAGIVQTAPLSALLGRGTVLSSAFQNIATATYEGDRPLARFGYGVWFADVTGDGADDLIVAAPERSNDWTGILPSGRMNGAVYVYSGPHIVTPKPCSCGLLAAAAPCPCACADTCAQAGVERGHFGLAIAPNQFASAVLVGAFMESEGASVAGNAYVVATQ